MPAIKQTPLLVTRTNDFLVEIDDSQNVIKVDAVRIIEVVRTVLALERCVSANISVALMDDETIHDLNCRYLQHDFATDVLSFLLECELEPTALPISKGSPRGAGKRLDGEIIASAEMAKRMSEKYGWRPIDELTLYVVHGLLHLCGYDDVSARDEKLMRQREREVLATWKLEPHYDA